MFKKLLLCAGLVASIYASENADELEITLENQTSRPLTIRKVVEDYSNLSSGDIGEGMEIESGESINFRVFILSSRYFTHVYQNTRCDGIMFKVLDTDESKENFSIFWEKNLVTAGDLEKLRSYKIEKKDNTKNDRFEFALLNK